MRDDPVTELRNERGNAGNFRGWMRGFYQRIILLFISHPNSSLGAAMVRNSVSRACGFPKRTLGTRGKKAIENKETGID